MNQFINGYELFSEILKDIYSPVEDGWSTFDVVLRESGEKSPPDQRIPNGFSGQCYVKSGLCEVQSCS